MTNLKEQKSMPCCETSPSNKEDYLTCEDEYNHFYKCHECGEIFPIDDMISIQNNHKICYNCYESFYTTCEICGDVIPVATINNVAFGSETIDACEDCALHLRTIFKEKTDTITLLHHHNSFSTDFIQFDFNIILREHLDSNEFLNIINNINAICTIHDTPLFYLKKVDTFHIIGLTTHFLDLNTSLYKKIITDFATYIAFEPNVLYLESFHLRIECEQKKKEIYQQMMHTLLIRLFPNSFASLNLTENGDRVEFNNSTSTIALNKADFYRTCMQYF